MKRWWNELIEERISDRQLDECDLTLGELKTIADRFRFTLLSMLHSRIAYPKSGQKPTAPRDESLLREHR
jgi:membrane-associated HD superfamily phosphohydrolase